MSEKRQIITEKIQEDWLYWMESVQVADAITYLKTLNPNFKLIINWHGYDSANGYVEHSREETDDEYESRRQYELETAQEKLNREQEKVDKAKAELDAEIAELEAIIAKLKGKQ